MSYLRVKELAEARGLTIVALQRASDVPLSTLRRYWWSSRSGLARDAGTMREANLIILSQIAVVLNVQPGDLLGELL